MEFAFIAPALLLLVFGTASFGAVLTIDHGVQQLASEAARASVAGLSDAERDVIARTFISTNLPSYAFIDPSALTVTTTSSAGPLSSVFSVSVRYDLSGSAFLRPFHWLPLPPTAVQRTAVVQRGGY